MLTLYAYPDLLGQLHVDGRLRMEFNSLAVLLLVFLVKYPAAVAAALLGVCNGIAKRIS